MNSALVIMIWVAFAVCMVLFIIINTRLILKLRDKYPGVYSKIGRPSIFSRNINFLWRLVIYKDELDALDLRLVRINFILIYACIMLLGIFVFCLVYPVF